MSDVNRKVLEASRVGRVCHQRRESRWGFHLTSLLFGVDAALTGHAQSPGFVCFQTRRQQVARVVPTGLRTFAGRVPTTCKSQPLRVQARVPCACASPRVSCQAPVLSGVRAAPQH